MTVIATLLSDTQVTAVCLRNKGSGMTIGIGVVTSEALVLGCDSIATTLGYFVPAFGSHVSQNEDQSFTANFGMADVVTQVTNSWGGVTKMFQLHGGSTPVAAVTAGLAKLHERTMNSCAHEFFLTQKKAQFPLTSVESVAKEFLTFMRAKYDEHYVDSEIPVEFREGPVFLVGGYDQSEYLPTLFRIDVQQNSTVKQFSAGESGIAWQGQSDAVERLMRGYDSALRISIERAVTAGLRQARDAMGQGVATILQNLIERLGQEAMRDVAVEVPEPPPISLPWNSCEARIIYANLPLQDAIDFAAYLVNLQSGRAKFAEGVPTVGGRTHVGVITKQNGFSMLEEPELVHRNTGFV
jgi:hypothetical protein